MIDRILIFGDSITQGFWDSKGGWVQRLIDHYFNEQMKDLEADMPVIFNLGISADTTEELLVRFEPETRARLRSSMAFVFAIGTNDSRIDGETPFSTPDEYAANIETLIAKATQFADKSRILFVGLQPCDEARTMPVSWREVSYTNERLQRFDKTLRQVCAKQGVEYVPVFESYQKQQTTKGTMLIDGLHPDDDGHACIYEQVKPYLERLDVGVA